MEKIIIYKSDYNLNSGECIYLVRLDKTKNGYSYLCVDKYTDGCDEYFVGGIVQDLEDYYVEETDINISEIYFCDTPIFKIAFLNNDNTNGIIKWLEDRIEATTNERKLLNTDDNLNLMIGKGGKLTAYKEVLNYLKTH